MENDQNPLPHGQQVWRERHLLDPEVARLLRKARWRRGWSLRAAERHTGVSAGHLCNLENGKRAPSVVVVDAIVVAYRLTGSDAARLRAAGLNGVGRDWRPSY
jgi:transcriptional regulator with XRE-family HTH domain